MAIFRRDGAAELEDGRLVYAEDPVLVADLCELSNLLCFAEFLGLAQASSAGGSFGSAGGRGSPGARGAQGPGSTDGLGTQGPQGPFGGPQGPQGPSGFQGNQGAQGIQGFQGAVQIGPQGPQGTAGLTGSQGPQGFAGSGPQGPQGLSGAQGFQGIGGAQGPQGFQGIGTQGNQGFQGSGAGVQGAQGNQGVASSGTASFPLLAPDGSVSAPPYSFAAATNTGMFLVAAGNLGFAVNGVLALSVFDAPGTSVFSSALSVTVGTIAGGDGFRSSVSGTTAAVAYGFTSDPDTGLFLSGSNLGFSAGGTESLTVTPTGVTVTGKLTVTGLIDPTVVYLDEQGADIPNIANKGAIYTKDVAGITQLFYRRSNGTVLQVT